MAQDPPDKSLSDLSSKQIIENAYNLFINQQLAEAKKLCLLLLEKDSASAEGHYLLGNIEAQQNCYENSLHHFGICVDQHSEHGPYWLAYIDALISAGQPDVARQTLEMARQAGLAGPEVDNLSARLTPPDRQQQAPLPDPDTLISLYNQGDFTGCEHLALYILEKFPEDGFTWKLLGAVLQQQNRLEEAIFAMRQAVRLLPQDTAALNNLGLTLKNMGKLQESETILRQAITLCEHFAEAHNNLGVTLLAQGRLAEAESHLRRALQLEPEYTEAHCNLGLALKDQGKIACALESLENAVRLNPSHAEAHNNLGNILQRLGRLTEAEAHLRQALAAKPDFAVAWNTLAYILHHQGRLTESQSCYEKTLSLKPDYAAAFDGLLFVSNYHADAANEDLFLLYRQYDKQFGIPLQNQWHPHTNSHDPQRRLRIGYVSPAFYSHPIRHFLEPLLANHDKSKFEVFAYAEKTKEDQITQTYRQYADHWIETSGLSDDELAAKIREDEIDVLIDLAGHTGCNRLLVFARKPAPVSLHWLDFGYTTGLSAIDYYLTDIDNAPLGSEHLFSEQLWRLPAPAYVYRPAPDMGEISQLPAQTRGYVTFGTLTRAIRINHRTLRVWAAILHRVNGSRLIIDSGNFKDQATQDAMKAQFAAHGIDGSRLLIGYHSPPWDVLRNMDISLDCFPHNSGTTLFESLYMGVPFITLAHRPALGRLGCSVLQGVGHPEWIAVSEEEYIDKAVALAADLPHLAAIRAVLRQELEKGPLMDEPGFARLVEDACRQMFRKWCNEITASPSSAASGAVTGYNLAITHQTENRLSEAKTAYLTALNHHPGFVEAANNLGVVFQQEKRYNEAEACFLRALALKPDYADAWYNLGNTYRLQDILIKAEAAYRKALQFKPNHVNSLNNLGNNLQEQGQLEEAETCLRQVLTIVPDHPDAFSTLLYTLNYHPDKKQEEIYRAYTEFSARFFLPHQASWKPHTNTSLKNRRLRVAYVAPDYRNHPARYFLLPLLAHHDRSMLEVYAYVECSSDRADGEIFSGFAEHWTATQGMSDDQLSERIRHDAIDVLIDLAGHTAHNRLGVFARKPAPVSLHWLDYAYTTGLPAINYYLADPASLPEGCEPFFAERLWRIATPALAYRPPEDTGPVNALPAEQNGFITFGTLTRAIRINHRTIRVWAEILKKCPTSRLIINSGSYREPGMQEALASRFAKHGIDRNRLNIGCTSPPWDVLRSMDIGLDCFPHNSGTTLFESLYMGVPFITLADRPSMGRLGSSILEGMGRPEWIAASEEEYIDKAVTLTADLPRLAAIRAGLRDEMRNSPLMDEAGFTRRMESAWQEMFQCWHEAQSVTLQDGNPAHPLPPKKKKSDGKKSGQKTAVPTPPPADIDRLLRLFQRGAHAEAIQLARQLTTRYPRHGIGWKILGPLLHQQGLKTEAIEAMTHAAQCLPDDPDTHFNLGIALEQAGRLAEAEDRYRQALQRNPHHLQALYNLGNVLKGKKELAEAESCYRRILQDQPKAVEALGNLGNVQRALGRLNEAASSYRQALRIRPDSAELLSNLGLTLRTLGAFPEAEAIYQQALSHNPNLPEAHNNLGLVFQDQGRLTEAAACFQQALQSNPQYAVAWHNLGNTRVKQGRLDVGEGCLRKAIELQPQNASIYSDLLFLLNNHPDKGSEEIFNDYKLFNTRFGLPLQGQWRPFTNLPSGNRRLKIGYVSSNFSRHSTRYFLEPLLARHNRDAFEIFLYTDQTREDEVTARYRSYADHWQQCTGITDDALARAIRSDAIDILVDLAGHTGGNRLGVFARKPAPVSLHWLDFGYTTGLTAIDYYLTDAATVPAGTENLLSETPWRIKTPSLVYRPEAGMGEVSALPALECGFIRFGTLTRALRINHRTIRVWSEILHRVPNAHLVIDSGNFKDETARTTLITRFTAHGIDPSRLDIGFHSPPWDLLRGMDIGLDCFPHNSGTTLFENLYMGLPFVTLADRPCTGRIGCAILDGLGHPEWIAHSEQEYVEIAVKLASDLPELASLRAGLRQEMLTSALMDEPAFAAKVEDAYQEMFERWCQKGTRSPVPPPTCNTASSTGPLPPATNPVLSVQENTTPPASDIDNLLALYHRGNLTEAANHARTLLKEYPRHGFTWKVLGTTLQQLGQSGEAIPALQRALELLPDDADCHNTYGVALFKEGRHSDAEDEISRALQLNPGYADAYLNLGDILQHNGHFPEAEAHYRKSISLNPVSTHAHCNLGKSLFEQGRAAEAEAAFRQAIQLQPDFAEAHNSLGNALMAKGANTGAEQCYRQSIRHRPNFAEAHNNLGIVLQKQGSYSEAEGCFRQALQIKPDYAAGHCNLGNLLKEAGRLAEAEASYRQALRLQPDSPAMYSNLLFLLNNDPDKSAEAIYGEYGRFNELFGLPHLPEWRAFTNDCRQDRRLKIGYVSPYFSKHSTRHFLEPLLACHDKEEVEVFLYSDLYHDDEVTLRYRSYADHWRRTCGMSDTALCDRIYADGIDILIDLAGHTGGNRLGVFARKPAPVSLHWLDFGYTTGLTAIDYYLTDAATVPVGSEGLFSETPWRLDTPALVYRPAEGMGEAGDLPALRAGHVTFGTLTRALRINHRTIRVWAKILKRVPQSHLVIDSGNFRDKISQKALAEQFLRQGVGPGQLEIGYHSPPWDLLRRIDIGFDCFPHNSGTTLIESLYMGSPFITLADRPSIGRLGAAILEGVGHPEWIAPSEEEYIEKAVHLAADLPRLAAIRAGLRQEMERSPLMDEPGFARRVEKAYQEMFGKWCKDNHQHPLPPALEKQAPTPLQALLRQAEKHLSQSQFQLAVPLLQQVLAIDPVHPEANFHLGLIFVKNNQIESALPCLAQAVETQPENGSYWIAYIDALDRSGQTDSARQLLTMAIEAGLDGDDTKLLQERLRPATLQPPPPSPPKQCSVHGIKKIKEKKKGGKPSSKEVKQLQSLYQQGHLLSAENHAHELTQRYPHHGFAWKVLGGIYLQQGKNEESLDSMLRASRLMQDDYICMRNIAVILCNMGKNGEAEKYCKQALAIKSDYADAYSSLSVALRSQKKLDEAEKFARQALTLQPDSAEYSVNLGLILHEKDKDTEAETCYRQALHYNPSCAEAYCGLGQLFQSFHRANDAEESYHQALHLNPVYPAAYNALGGLYYELARYKDAEKAYRQALQQKTDYQEALLNLIKTLCRQNNFLEAEVYCRQFLSQEQGNAEVWFNFGNALAGQQRNNEAEIAFRNAIQIQPDYPEATLNLGNSLRSQGWLFKAEKTYRTILASHPDNSMAYNNLGNILQEQGRLEEAEVFLRSVIDRSPEYDGAFSNLLYLLNYHPDKKAEEIFLHYREFEALFALPHSREWLPHLNSRNHNRRLRIGYVSPQFCHHPVCNFLEPLLAHHNKSLFELYAYADIYKNDEVTDRYRLYFDHFISTKSLTNTEMAEQIRNDGIDILVDLAGHTGNNRLLVFARKPAPISLHWLDFGYTTGLTAIDYYLADNATVPVGSETLFAEKPWRLETPSLAYRPTTGMGEVNSLPAATKGYVTFGTLTRAVRINYRTIRVWAKILKKIPDSKLVINSGSFKDPAMCNEFADKFAGQGIDRDRLDIGYQSPPWDVLRLIDIGFDCFPHNSGTTLFENLYMGVPFITLADRPSVGRLGAATLEGVGHPEWIAYSEEDYIEKAVHLAADLPRLAAIRAGLRQEMERSPLMDEPGFASRVEKAYREMFSKWCEEQQ